MASQPDEPLRFIAPIGGMNYGVPLVNQPDGVCRRLVNGEVVNGGISARSGISVEVDSGHSSLTTFTYLMRFVSKTTDHLLIVASNSKVHRYTGFQTTSAVYTASTGTVTENVAFNFNGQLCYSLYPITGPRTWDGTTDAALSITLPITGAWSSLAASDITGGCVFKGHVYYWSRKCSEFIYTALNAIGGTTTAFPLSRVSTTGGNILMVTTLTMDGGNGPDDLIAFILDTGECLIYQGSDPASADDWSLIGRYQVSPPVSASAQVRMGGDVLLLTNSGLLPLQQFIKASFGKVEAPWLDAINPRIRLEFASGITTGSLYYSPTYRRLFVGLRNGASCLVFDADQGYWSEYLLPGTINTSSSGYGLERGGSSTGSSYAIFNVMESNSNLYFTLEGGPNNLFALGKQLPVSYSNADAGNAGFGIKVAIIYGVKDADTPQVLQHAQILGAGNKNAFSNIICSDFVNFQTVASDTATGTPFPANPYNVNVRGRSFQNVITFDGGGGSSPTIFYNQKIYLQPTRRT